MAISKSVIQPGEKRKDRKSTKLKVERKNPRKAFIWGIALLAMTIILQIAARKIEGFATWYATVVYPFLAGIEGAFWNLIPFPVAELILYLLIIVFIIYLIRFWGKPMGQRCRQILSVALPLLLFLYTINGGINYYAKPFIQYAGLQPENYTKEELVDFCEFLVRQINDTVTEDSYRDNRKEWQQEGIRAVKRVGEQYNCMSGFYPVPKTAIAPSVMSAQRLRGIYIPFTMEVYWNGDMPDYNIPHTICHELSHAKGFMREDEAGFIGYLACIGSENQAFRYSGYLTGWEYAGNALAQVDMEAYRALSNQLKPQVKEDLKENNSFWSSYGGIVEHAARTYRDTYFKMNGQEDGIQSYNRVVDLMIAHYTGTEEDI